MLSRPAPNRDYLKMKTNAKTLKALCANGANHDTCIWSSSVVKINRKGKSQTRALLITNRHVFNLMPDNFSKCNRCIDLRNIHHITTSKSANEFVIHVTDEYDYRFKVETTKLLDEAVETLQKTFEQAKGTALEVIDMDISQLSRQVMTKAAADTGFIEKETARLKKMMDDGSVKAAKKEQFGRRLNMLSSFS